MAVKFAPVKNGYAVDFGTVDGAPTVYLARFSKGKRQAVTKLTPEEAEDISRKLASAAARAAAKAVALQTGEAGE